MRWVPYTGLLQMSLFARKDYVKRCRSDDYDNFESFNPVNVAMFFVQWLRLSGLIHREMSGCIYRRW